MCSGLLALGGGEGGVILEDFSCGAFEREDEDKEEGRCCPKLICTRGAANRNTYISNAAAIQNR